MAEPELYYGCKLQTTKNQNSKIFTRKRHSYKKLKDVLDLTIQGMWI